MRFLDKIKADDLLRHIAILFSGMVVVHICNIFFQMGVGRILPEQEYVLLAAFLGVLAIIQRPLSTLRTGLSHYSSILQQENRVGDIKRLLRKWLLLAGAPSLLLGCIVLFLGNAISGYFHLERIAPVIISGAVLPALFIIPVLGGAAQGLQMFKWCSAANISSAMIRLGLGVGFVWLLYPACGWAMLGHGLGIYVGSSVLFFGLLGALRGHAKTKAPLPSMRFYLFQSFMIQAAYAILMTADVVLIKHYLPEDTEFAYAATLGRMVVFLPSAIVGAMFPKVASKGAGTKQQRNIFLRSFGMTAVFVVAAVAGCFLLAGLLARVLFGISGASDYLRLMIGQMALVMGLSALLNVVVQFFVAQRRFMPAFSVVFFALVYLGGAMLLHDTSLNIVILSGLCNGGALLACILALFMPKRAGGVSNEVR